MSAIKATLNKLEFTSSKVLDGILKVLGYGGGVVLILWIFVFVGTVAARAFFHATPVYLEEYTEYFVVFIAATGLAYALRKGLFTHAVSHGLKYLGHVHRRGYPIFRG